MEATQILEGGGRRSPREEGVGIEGRRFWEERVRSLEAAIRAVAAREANAVGDGDIRLALALSREARRLGRDLDRAYRLSRGIGLAHG